MLLASTVRISSNTLFFLPQYVFGLDQCVRPSPGGYGYDALFSPGVAHWITAIFWAALAIAFGGSAPRVVRAKWWWLFPVALLTILATTLVANIIFGSFGYAIQLDGP